MKKKKVNGLHLNKNVISSLEKRSLKGGAITKSDGHCTHIPSHGVAAACEPSEGSLCSWWIFCPSEQ